MLRHAPCHLILLAATSAALLRTSVLHAEVDWDIENGWLVARAGDTSILAAAPLPAADAVVDDRPLLAGNAIRGETQKTADGGFTVTYRTDRGTLSDHYVPFADMGDQAWLRSVVYENTSANRQDLLSVDLRVGPAVHPESRWRTRDFWMGQMTPSTAVCVSYRGEGDHYALDEEATGLPVHRVQACWRLEPGQSARVGQQGIWLGTPGREPFRAEARRWYQAIGLHTTSDLPDWLRGAILYQTSAGGHVEARFSDVGGFDHLATQVDYLADLGITAVWLQAVHQHKTPPNPVEGGWNCYDPRDFSKIDPILGGAEGFRRLTDAFRQRGIQVLGEIVPHGGRSVQAEALPDWWTRGRDGQPQRNWGGYGMDYASPAWQAVMRDAAAMLAREGGVEGLRVDVADGSGPNWGSPRTHHASYSGLGGAVELLTALRDGLRDGGASHGVLIPEAPNTVEFFPIAPVGYDHHGWFLMGREIPALIQDPRAMRDRLRDYFENTRGTLPPGSVVLRTLNNHDTVVESGRVHYRYGAGLARALYGVCLMVEGIPMLYQEEEKGSFEALRRLNLARRRIPEFTSGAPDYLSVDLAPEVFACVRSTEHGCAVGLSNLGGSTVRGVVMLPRDVAPGNDARVYDAVSGHSELTRDGTFPWQLGPYETALIRVGQPPLPEPAASSREAAPAENLQARELRVKTGEEGLHIEHGELTARFSAGPGPWRETEQPGRFESDSGWLAIERLSATEARIECQLDVPTVFPELVLFHARRWRVSGRTALLDDRVLRRSYPFPPQSNHVWERTMAWGRGPYGAPYYGVAPAGRLWESILEPLHPDQGGLALSDPHGNGLLISEIDTSARHLVLTDRTDQQPDAPYGLALRFYARDPDLAPAVALLGLGQPFVFDAPPPPVDLPVRARFHVRAVAEPDIEGLLAAQRLPVDRGEPVFRFEGPEVRREHDSIWFVQPGAAVWEHLSVRGRYRLRVELRHSESSETGRDLADAYQLEINGTDVPFEWVSLNTYRTGNAYFGHVLTDPVELDAGIRSMRLTATRNWAAMRGKFHLVPCE